MARGKKGKKNKKDDYDDEDFDNIEKKKEDENNINAKEEGTTAGLSRKEKRQQKLKKKNQNMNQNQTNDEGALFLKIEEDKKEEVEQDENDIEEEEEEEEKPIPKMSKKQKKKKKVSNFNDEEDESKGFGALLHNEDDDEEIEEIPEPIASKKKSNNKKKGKKAVIQESDESEVDVDLAALSAKTKSKSAFAALDDSDDDTEEDEPPRKKGGFSVFNNDSDEDESEEEIIPVKKNSKKNKKSKPTFQVLVDSEEEEEELPAPISNTKGKQSKKGNKKGRTKKVSSDEEEDKSDEPSSKKGSVFAMLDDSDDEEVEIGPAKKSDKKNNKKSKTAEVEEQSKASKTQSKKGKKGKSKKVSSDEEEGGFQPQKKSAFCLLESDDDDEEDEEEEEIKPLKKSAKKSSKEKKGKSSFVTLESESEEDEHNTKSKSSFQLLNDSEEDVDDDDEKTKKRREKEAKKAEKAKLKAEKEQRKLEKEQRKAEKEARKAEKEARKAEKEARKAEKEKAKKRNEVESIEKENKEVIEEKKEVVEEKEKPMSSNIITEKNEPPVIVPKGKNANPDPDKEKKQSKIEKSMANKKKSKLELQIEAAMVKRKQVEEEEKAKKEKKEQAKKGSVDELVVVKPKKAIVVEEKKVIKEYNIKLKDSDDEEGDIDEDEIFEGAPDEQAWSDKSHAQRLAEEQNGSKKDDIPTHGADGKKLSNRDRKKLLKQKEAALRQAEYEANAIKLSAEGAQFACSQTAFSEDDPQWQNALDINIPSFSISVAGKILFKDSPFNISHGRRYGIVGPNGKGKSTMLKMIASGDMKLPPRIDYLYVEQEVVADDTTAIEAVLRADKERFNLLEEEKQLSKEVDEGNEDPKLINRLQEVYEQLQAMGADSAEAKARRILHGLGFGLKQQDKATKLFSGGWRMRISLARALFIEPTLLMLDEPTNHLDLNAVIWLDNYLATWKKTLIVVSHDQDFLNSVCEEILHIEDLKVVPYKGNYDSFKKAEAEKRKQQEKEWQKQQKRLRELKRSGQSKAKATETLKKSKKEKNKKQDDAIASGQATAQQVELIKRPKDYVVTLHFPEVPELSRPVLEVHDVHFRYSKKHPVIFDNIDFGLDMDSRICVVGPNGAGKSTLLKLLTGEITPTKGDVRTNPRLRMGVYNQHFVDRLPMEKTPVEYLRSRYEEETYQTIRNNLGKFGLEGHAHEVAMRDLSGGQKARVVFVDLSLQQPHVLLLDEPTNNLDIETIDALIEAINEFNGGIVIVTHDQRLIEECDCTLWVVEKMGVTNWEAGFDDYKDTILRAMEDEIERDQELRRQKLEAAAIAKRQKLARIAATKK